MAPSRNGQAGRTHSGEWYMDRTQSDGRLPPELGKRGKHAATHDLGSCTTANIGRWVKTDDLARRTISHDIVKRNLMPGLQEESRHGSSGLAGRRTDLPKLDVGRCAKSANSLPAVSPKNNCSPLHRENKQLRGELRQMQVTLLDGLRRSDRFIAGGQFKAKNKDSPQVQLAEHVRHLKTVLQRAHKSNDHLQKQLADATHDFEVRSAEKDAKIDALITSAQQESTDSLKREMEEYLRESRRSQDASEQLESQLKSSQSDLHHATIALTRETDRTQASTEEVERLTAENDLLTQYLKDAVATLQDGEHWKRDFQELDHRFNELTQHSEALQHEVLKNRNGQQKDENAELERLTAEVEQLREEGRSRESHQAEVSQLLCRYKIDDERLKQEKRLWSEERVAERSAFQELRASFNAVIAEKSELAVEKTTMYQSMLAQQETSKESFIRTINLMMDNSWPSMPSLFSGWRMQVNVAKREAMKVELRDAEKASEQVLRGQDKVVGELQHVKAELSKLRTEVQSLKNDIWRLKKERTDEREKNRKYVASLKKIVQDGAQEVTANRQQYLEAQQKLEKALVEVDGSRREVATANEMMAEMETKLKAERRQALSSRLKSQLKLQILAPHVTVTVGAGEATDAESAPSPDSIRKVMMEQVLPKFAHVIVGDENDNSVEEVIEDMLKSIEARLIGIFGRSCRGTAQHNSSRYGP
eukprot:GEMP01021044.1.p1 GENE.GEMP01021044.1~~GEMP01021044.1.p1  ORF type:complete len:712 (+),score=181.16 GEMP01021044.1:22-2136(+)